MEHLCKNCLLFRPKDNACEVRVMIEGETYELPVHPEDPCHWEKLNEEIDATLTQEMKRYNHPYFKAKFMEELATPIAIKQIRIYSDGKNGYIEES